MKSKINTAMNTIAGKIEKVTVKQLTNNPLDGEIISIEFKDGQIKHINTHTNVISSSMRQANTKKETNCKLQNGRLTTVLYFKEYKYGTRIQLGALVGIALDIYNGVERDSYVEIEMNHKDRTGKQYIYNYINNKAYNVEMVSSSKNKRHWKCVERVQKELGLHIAFSANNEEFMDIIEFNDAITIKDYIEHNIKFVDNHGTLYI